jgi:hypothetical protein
MHNPTSETQPTAQGTAQSNVPPAPGAAVQAPPPAIPGRASNAYRGLTIAAFVLSVISFLGVLGICAFIALGVAGGEGMVPLTGEVTVAAGQPLPGEDLAHAIEQRIIDDGAVDVALECPDTPKVDQGVVTVCHGDIDGGEWAVIVYFEDELGTYTLNPI